MKHEPTRTYMRRDFTDYKTAEDRLKQAGTNDWKGTLLSVIVGTILAFMLAGLTGLVLGALSALI